MRPHESRWWTRTLRFGRSNVAADVDDEIRFHVESRIEDLVARGVASETARAQAEREFGDIAEVRRGLVSIDRRVAAKRSRAETIRDVVDDVRFAARSLRRTPGAAIAILATLALGVGVNASMYTLLNAIFLRPPAGVAAPDELRRVWFEMTFRDGRQFWSGFSYPQYDAVRGALAGQAATGLYRRPETMRIGAGESFTQAQVVAADRAFFDVVGARPAVGRLFSAEEDALAAPARVMVISDAYWRRALNADPMALGSTLRIAGTKHTIIGIMAPGFAGVDLDAADLWVPLASAAEGRTGSPPWWQSHSVNGFQLVVRPQAGSADRRLEQQITAALRRPDVALGRGGDGTVARFGSIVAANGPGNKPQEQQIAMRLAGVTIVVLLIACANVVNLLLARAARRRREIAVRLALGISRARLLRLLLVESALLAACAASGALLVAYVGGTLLRTLLLPDVHWSRSPLDWSVAFFALGVALASGVCAGLIPAMKAARPELTSSLKTGSGSGAAPRSRLRRALVIVQAALSVVLLVGASLFVRSLRNVHDVDIGYDASRITTISVTFDGRSRGSDPTFGDRLATAADRIRRLPGAERVGLASGEPMAGFSVVPYFTEKDSLGSRGPWLPTVTAVSPDYFAATGLRVLHGSTFRTNGVAPSVIVSDAMARVLWPGRNPVGECLRLEARSAPCFTVIGVVENGRMGKVLEEPQPQFYLEFSHAPASAKFLRQPYYIIARGDPALLSGAAVRGVLREAFPGGIPYIKTMGERLDPQYRPWRLGATLFTAFGALALVVAVIGIYGTVSYGVTQRTHEFGVRIALGARVADVLRIVVGEGVGTVAVGVIVGSVLALLTGKLIASLLFGVTTSDPVTYAIAAATLVIVAAVASLVPALRAARVDPASALRAD